MSMESRKIELVGFDLHNYCTKQDEEAEFCCESMQCENCEHNKPYWLTTNGEGIDVEELKNLYEIEEHEAGGHYYIRLRKLGGRNNLRHWIAGLVILFLIIFGASYYYAAKYFLQ